MDEFVSLDITQDNGGVHINSGIPNRACFLIAATIGRDKTERIYYRILEGRYLSAQATFVDMRLAALQATADLYGADGAEARAVADAFDAVGIAGGTYAEAPVDRAPVVAAPRAVRAADAAQRALLARLARQRQPLPPPSVAPPSSIPPTSAGGKLAPPPRPSHHPDYIRHAY